MKIQKMKWSSFIGTPKVVLLFTGNMSSSPQGNAVMGAGLAKELAKYAPELKATFSEELLKLPIVEKRMKEMGNGTLLPFNIHKPSFINCGSIALKGSGLFSPVYMLPVKRAFWDKAEIDLIRRSLVTLGKKAADNPEITYVCNFPGIGAGGLKYMDVLEVAKKALEHVPNVILLLKDKKKK